MSFFLHVTLIYATNSMLNLFHSIVIPKYQEKTKSYNLVLIATCSRFYGFVSLFHTVSHLQGASRMRGRLGSLGSMSSFDKVSVHSEGTQNSPRKDSGNCHPSPSPLPPFFFFFFLTHWLWKACDINDTNVSQSRSHVGVSCRSRGTEKAREPCALVSLLCRMLNESTMQSLRLHEGRIAWDIKCTQAWRWLHTLFSLHVSSCVNPHSAAYTHTYYMFKSSSKMSIFC